jgi:hypothetical protein
MDDKLRLAEVVEPPPVDRMTDAEELDAVVCVAEVDVSEDRSCRFRPALDDDDRQAVRFASWLLNRACSLGTAGNGSSASSKILNGETETSSWSCDEVGTVLLIRRDWLGGWLRNTLCSSNRFLERAVRLGQRVISPSGKCVVGGASSLSSPIVLLDGFRWTSCPVPEPPAMSELVPLSAEYV